MGGSTAPSRRPTICRCRKSIPARPAISLYRSCKYPHPRTHTHAHTRKERKGEYHALGGESRWLRLLICLLLGSAAYALRSRLGAGFALHHRDNTLQLSHSSFPPFQPTFVLNPFSPFGQTSSILPTPNYFITSPPLGSHPKQMSTAAVLLSARSFRSLSTQSLVLTSCGLTPKLSTSSS
jgi:hypothetical protein